MNCDANDLSRLPEIHDALRSGWHQADEVHPRTFDIGRRRHAVGPEPHQDQGAHGRPFEADRLAGDQDRVVAVAGDQAIERDDLHGGHRGERGHAFLIFEGLCEACHRGLVQFAGAMQRQDRAL
ncbi:hypothetical protein chiPu_0028556, partial [Chiloscyllium punctatum]|nr:hypothetical protein [Chiloscyllium punctatum]